MNRWSKSGVLDRMFAALQQAQVVRIKIEAVSLDSTIVTVHLDGTGALERAAHNPSASPEAGWTVAYRESAAHSGWPATRWNEAGGQDRVADRRRERPSRTRWGARCLCAWATRVTR
jgi:hypothetical protein